MLTTEQATQLILANAGVTDSEEVRLEDASGRILSEPLLADRDFPPFARVSMDGIALAYHAFEKGQKIFPLEGIQAAGAPPHKLKNPMHALEVMTGAMLPEGADTVIRYEDLHIEGRSAQILIKDVRAGQNIHPRGNDRKTGDEIVPAGRQISAAEIGVAATVGKTFLRVLKLPSVAVITTGDELVRVGAQPLPHQIRMSNLHSIQSLLQQVGISAGHYHLNDDLKATQKGLSLALQEHDVLIISGGVSEGKYDYVPQALAAEGVQQLFHKVSQRPGKPFWFGKTAAGKVVFALPGNPVSTFVGVVRYFLPWFRQSMGQMAIPDEWASLAEPFEFKPELTYFLQVKVRCTPAGQTLAWPLAGKGSGDLANLVDADGFLELGRDQDYFQTGEAFRLWRYR
jgi:molybdopterin molybdotransferase